MKLRSFLALCVSVVKLVASQEELQQVRDCLSRNDSLDCLKRQALEFINQSVYSNEPMSVFGIVDVVKDEDYKPKQNPLERSNSVDDVLHRKIEEFFESRNIKVNLQNVFEGRKKGGGGGGKKGNLMFLGGLAMAAAIGQLIMGKIAFIAGAALLLAKLALALSTIVGFKKLSGGGGGGDNAHVVYASNPSGYGGHSHGSWHRSLSYEDEPQNPVYQGYIPINDNNNLY